MNENKMKTKKGQFFSYDAIIASILFGIVISLVFVYWISIRGMLFSEANEMFSLALTFSDSLMKPGYPSNWNEIYNGDIKNIVKISAVGLTDGYSSKINLAKFSSFSDLTNLAKNREGYERIRESYGFYKYHFFVILEYDGEVNIAGNKVDETSNSVKFTKPVVVNGRPGNLTIIVWR